MLSCAQVGALRSSQPTRFLSAEGCYSVEAVKANLRLKIANKQAVGLDVPSTQQASTHLPLPDPPRSRPPLLSISLLTTPHHAPHPSPQVLFVSGATWACSGDVMIDETLMRELAERTQRTVLLPLRYHLPTSHPNTRPACPLTP
jgi:hypothetical protein